jgi:glycosyltransferase involved in cell wall biosynthesis
MRIIQIVENLDKGAVENWLVNIFLESRKLRPEWEWTFYCILGEKGRLDQKVTDAGGKIIYSPYTLSHKIQFLKHLRKTLKQGHYDILHAHHDYLSGFYLLATVGLSFKKRFLQVHNTDKGLPIGNVLVHRIMVPVLGRLAMGLTDSVVGISEDTLKEFVGEKKRANGRNTLLYYGIDLSAFSGTVDAGVFRQELGLPAGAKILLFAGRMNELKNPAFVVDILNSLLQVRQDVYAVFVGKGGEEENVVRKSEAYGIRDRIRLCGWRDDIPAVMKAADVFVFPRVEYPREGLGLVVVEAQAAGLPMVLSKGIVADAIIIDELAHVLTLNNNPAEWAIKIDAVLNAAVPVSRQAAFERMMQSRFELRKATENLLSLYAPCEE